MKEDNNYTTTIGKILGWILFLAVFTLIACTESRGFVLPDGSVEIGKQTFTELGCNHCHSIADVMWIGSEDLDDPHIKLGGEVSSMKTYGQLVTSVINPSHKISQKSKTDQVLTDSEGRSKMETYAFNQIMTVQELVDIVTFLQSEYELITPPNPHPYH